MSKIKNSLPNLAAVQKQFDKTLEASLTEFLNSTHVRRQAVIGNLRFAMMAFFLVLAVIFLLYFVFSNHPGLVSNLLMGSSMLWLTVVLLSARQWLTNYGLLAKEVNMALVPLLVGTLDRMLVYSHNEEHREDTKKLLIESGLMTMEDIEVVSDDMYTVYMDQEVSFRELDITQKIKNRIAGKNYRLNLFRGVFMVADLPNFHNAKTYISTENDKTGFAHRDFWSSRVGSDGVEETVLEWNEFEKYLHVASSDAVVAREIMTPDFMQDLYDWWSEHKLNMRISCIGDKMFMLLPETSIKIAASTTSTEVKDIRRYAWSLVRPIWRSLVLVEDVLK